MDREACESCGAIFAKLRARDEEMPAVGEYRSVHAGPTGGAEASSFGLYLKVILVVFGMAIAALWMVGRPRKTAQSTDAASAVVDRITHENFNQKVIESNGVYLVYFWATWCGPCRQFGPIYEQYAAESVGRVSLGKANVDENQELAQFYGIRAIPTVIVFRDGVEQGRLPGMPKDEFAKSVEPYL